MIVDFIVEIGLEAVKDKICDVKELNDIRCRLKEFVERQAYVNEQCSMEEEFDFQGLIEYIKNDLINDVQIRLFGDRKERGIARETIISKAIAYSQANNSLSRRRATDIIDNAMNILRDFYKKKVNRDWKYIASQIEDTIIEANSQKVDEQTEVILERVACDKQEIVGDIQDVKDLLNGKFPMSIEHNIKLIKDGSIKEAERNIALMFNTIGSAHNLFPDYCFDRKSGSNQLYSRPLSKDAIKKYPPKITCTGTIQVEGRYIDKFDCNTIEYANRHQLPIVLNVKTAQKFLGDVIDPVQHEADAIIGENITINPRPFPPAFPCSISLDSNVVFDYILFRTEEILDDGTIVISNYEQKDFPFRIKMSVNLETKKTTYVVKTENPNNEDMLKYLRFLNDASLGKFMSIKELTSGESLASGKLGDFYYKTGFESITEELNFIESIVAIEHYFDEKLEIPEEISEDDFDTINYLATLIKGDENIGKWSKLDFNMKLTEELKSKILKIDDVPFSLSYVGSISFNVWNKVFDLPVIRSFDSVKYQDPEKLKLKSEVLDIGDDIKLSFLPYNEESGIWRDMLYTENVK